MSCCRRSLCNGRRIALASDYSSIQKGRYNIANHLVRFKGLTHLRDHCTLGDITFTGSNLTKNELDHYTYEILDRYDEKTKMRPYQVDINKDFLIGNCNQLTLIDKFKCFLTNSN